VAATSPTPGTKNPKTANPKTKIRVKGRDGASGSGDKSVPKVASELWTLTIDYAKQEIKDPVKGLGTYLLWGSLSMLLVGFGMVLLAIGGLRALQTETGSTFTGSLTWAPYAIVLASATVVLGFGVWLVLREKK
jgi:hypothetical protein